ncbi:hypothetical protein BGZ96_011273 [Linnemannia gamsii]|uniref:Ndc10 domain-containing protein n=1 Tax=Linnemannia gamsii TaxID=64522 RepID=A0ABQ7JTD8_9FUNG|nr:hypothetical protein BGZ96_011273 [Linnemannia gamsii]
MAEMKDSDQENSDAPSNIADGSGLESDDDDDEQVEGGEENDEEEEPKEGEEDSEDEKEDSEDEKEVSEEIDDSADEVQEFYEDADDLFDPNRRRTANLVHYASPLGRWKSWCAQKMYADGDIVTREKLIRFAREATAQRVHVDDKNGHLSIEPFMTRVQGRRLARGTVNTYISAIRSLYREQRAKLGLPFVREDLGSKELSTILSDYKEFMDTHSESKELPSAFLKLRSGGKVKDNGYMGKLETNRTHPDKLENKVDFTLDTDEEEEEERGEEGEEWGDEEGRDESEEDEGTGEEEEVEDQEETEEDMEEGVETESEDEELEEDEEVEEEEDKEEELEVEVKATPDLVHPKRYPDGEKVTREKLGLYVTELSAQEAFENEDNPQLSVRPLILHYRRKDHPASSATLSKYVTFVRKLFMLQCRVDGNSPDLTRDLGPANLDRIIQEYQTFLKDSSLRSTSVCDDRNGWMGGGNDEGVIKTKPAPKTGRKRRAAGDDGDDDADGDSQKHQRSRLPARNGRYQIQVPAFNTCQSYLSCQKHWKAWCIRKRHTDGYAVTAEKYLAYAMEITAAEGYYDDSNPHLNVEPIYAYAGRPPLRRVSVNTIQAYLGAVRVLYNAQCVRDGITPDLYKNLDKIRVDMILQRYQDLLQKESSFIQETNAGRFGGNKHTPTEDQTDIDKQKWKGAVTSMAPSMQIMNALWAPEGTDLNQKSGKLALQDRFRSSFEYVKPDSGTELSTVLVSHLHLIHIESLDDWSHFTTGVALDKGLRKAHTGHERFSVFLRESDVDICPVGALGFYLLAIWTDKDSVPDLRSRDWENKRLLTLKGASKTMGSVRQTAAEATLNESGLDALKPHFHSGSPNTEPYMLSGSLQKSSSFKIPRSKVTPSEELQRQLFPFVEHFFPGKEDWKIWVDNVMAGRPEDTNRPKELQASYPRVNHPAIRLLLLLARLRKIILQDYAVLMAGEDDSGERSLDEFASNLRETTGAGSAQLTRLPGEADASDASATTKEGSPMDEDLAEGYLVQQEVTSEELESPFPGGSGF